MTVAQTAKKWHISTKRVYQLLLDGMVPGACKKEKKPQSRTYSWYVPDDAVRPAIKRKTPKKKCAPTSSLVPLNGRTHAQYIWAYQGKYSIGQLAEKLNISTDRVVQLYEQSFRTFTETGGAMP